MQVSLGLLLNLSNGESNYGKIQNISWNSHSNPPLWQHVQSELNSRNTTNSRRSLIDSLHKFIKLWAEEVSVSDRNTLNAIDYSEDIETASNSRSNSFHDEMNIKYETNFSSHAREENRDGRLITSNHLLE